MGVNHGLVAGALLSLNLLACLPVDPPLPGKLKQPVLRFSGMSYLPDPVDGYYETVRLSWTFNDSVNGPVHSFTLVRRFQSDSFFDVFPRSQQIPPDTAAFYDDLAGHPFPLSGSDTVFYRIVAIDTAGFAGDTSEPCRIILAPQPELTGYDTGACCLAWESWIRGGTFSHCEVWHPSKNLRWSSGRREEFPRTDEPARFSACFPDTFLPPPPGRWYYALFLQAYDAYALTIGIIDVD